MIILWFITWDVALITWNMEVFLSNWRSLKGEIFFRQSEHVPFLYKIKLSDA